jgi:hypothetical protein
MERQYLKRLFLPAMLGLVSSGWAQVDFQQVQVTQPVTIAQVQTAAGQSSSNGLGGVALGPGSQVFVIHRNALNEETFLRMNPGTGTADFSITGAAIKSLLGAPFNTLPNFPILAAEFIWDPGRGTAGTLYFVDESVAGPENEFALIGVDVAATTAVAVVTSSSISGMNSFGVLPSGRIVVALGDDHEVLTGGEPTIGLIDPDEAPPEYHAVFESVDFANAAGLPPTTEMPPDAVGVNPATGRVWAFIHDELLLFRSDNFDSSPSLNWVSIAGWDGVVDLHGVAVDADDNVYGYDEAAEALIVYDGSSTHTLTFDDIRIALGGTQPFTPVLWRGMKARKINATQSEVWLASSTADYGLVRVVFGSAPASVRDWTLY